MNGPVFIIANARSGTTWLREILASHPRLTARADDDRAFALSLRMAADQDSIDGAFPRLVRTYRWRQLRAWPRIHVDKSHPNLWIAEKLAARFQDAHFLGIRRQPLASVASMIGDRRVIRSIRERHRRTEPNPFLGIDGRHANSYESKSLEEQCTLRWLAHHRELDRLGPLLGRRLLTLDYERLVRDCSHELTRIQGFLELADPFPTVSPETEPLERWRTQLTTDQIRRIETVLAEAG